MQATQVLIEEHEGIKLMLRILGKICDGIEAGEAANTDHLADIIEFLQVFADQCHHGKEEDFLFPALEAGGVLKEGGPIGVMLHEHTLGRDHIKGMSEALDAYCEGDSDAGRAFVRHARGYIMLLMQHIEKENNVLFPMAQMTLSAQQDAELVQRFEQLEEERIGPGRHEAFHELMHQLEQIYLKP